MYLFGHFDRFGYDSIISFVRLIVEVIVLVGDIGTVSVDVINWTFFYFHCMFLISAHLLEESIGIGLLLFKSFITWIWLQWFNLGSFRSFFLVHSFWFTHLSIGSFFLWIVAEVSQKIIVILFFLSLLFFGHKLPVLFVMHRIMVFLDIFFYILLVRMMVIFLISWSYGLLGLRLLCGFFCLTKIRTVCNVNIVVFKVLGWVWEVA